MRKRCAALALIMVIPFRVNRIDQGPGIAPVAAPDAVLVRFHNAESHGAGLISLMKFKGSGAPALDPGQVVADNVAAVRQPRRYKGSSRFGVS